jgi:ribonuclease VapC
MIVIDSSVPIAILEHEPERSDFFRAIANADRRLISAVSYQETGQVIFSRRGANGVRDLEELIELMQAEIVPHDRALADFSIEAFKRYGKGIHPDARLNFCDCAAYALAITHQAPLLFKGADFAATDVQTVV